MQSADAFEPESPPSGYRIVSALCENDQYVVYRGQRVDDGEPVLLKRRITQAAPAAQVDGLRREFSVLQAHHLTGMLRARELIDDDTGCWLVLEDPDAQPLRSIITAGPVEPGALFGIAIELATALAALHEQDLIHHQLQPATILVHATTHRTWLVDLTSASGAGGERYAPAQFAYCKSVLPYISPEQTGRTNRTVDHRTDLYSLGVVLYELLTGVLPYRATDPMQLMHAHIARLPVSPIELRPETPEAVCRILLKLLEKVPDARYQSARGLLADLQQCARQWSTDRKVVLDELGTEDVPGRLLIPQRLYGREQALNALADHFEQACRGPTTLTLVSGYAGIGKTVLIQELYPWIARQQAYFIAGKFDQVVRNIPYGAMLQAFRALVRQILSEGDDGFAAWRQRLSRALGANAGVLSEVITEIELIIGDVPPVAPLAASEAQHRFRLVFQDFVNVLGSAEHPLVLFLDDLQWADPASLALLQLLLTSQEVKYLFMIGAYRDNEVGTDHPLSRLLAKPDASAAIRKIELLPLESADLQRFAADALRRDDDRSRWLADLLARKTGGNPFFLIQFLNSLLRDDLLQFDPEHHRWKLDQERISKVPITDNVIDLMTERIERLSAAARHVLVMAACIGNTFDTRTLGIVSQLSAGELDVRLAEIQAEGLILRAGDGVETGAPKYAFLHDRVQQAAYARLEECHRQAVHLTVGRLLLADSDQEAMEGRLFDIVEHLNIGAGLVVDPAERLNQAKLNYQAGVRAKSATAYQAAANFFVTGCTLLGRTHWDTQYELAFEMHLEAAECQYLCGNFTESEQRFDELVGKARSVIDKARVFALRVVQHENLSEFAKAARIGADGVALLGISFPDDKDGQQAAIDAELRTIAERLGDRSIGSLVSLPEMSDPEKRMAMHLLTVMWAPAYISAEVVPAALISARMVRLSIEFGNTAESAYGYVTHAITVGPTLGDYRSAYEWGTLALAVNDRFYDLACRAKIHQQFNAHVTLWRRPFESCISHARQACRVGMENGDLLYAGYGAFTESWPAFLISRDLQHFLNAMEPNRQLLVKIRTSGLVAAHDAMLNWAGALLDQTDEPSSLSGAGFSEADFIRQHGDNPFFMTVYYVAKLHLGFHFDHVHVALDAKAQAERINWGHGTIWPVLLRFWGGLALCGTLADDRRSRDRTRLPELIANREFLGHLAQNCAENFRCMFLVTDAEIERIEGRWWRSADLLSEAIAYARSTANLQQEALAQELTARLWLERQNVTVARTYAEAAFRAYADWGAAAKVRQLSVRFGLSPDTAGGGRELPVDIDSVTRAAHAVSQEIVLDALLRKILLIAMENAGARRAIFLQEESGQLTIKARADVDAESVSTTPARLEDSSALSARVVNYVRNTGESVVIGNAATDNRLASDPYIISTRPKSIVCLPVSHQGKRGGILYLENDVTTDAFTAAHLKVLDVLCAQAAISLDNARLYQEMREEIERRRTAEKQLREALDEVESLKNRLAAENIYLQEEIKSSHNYEEIVGSSPALLSVLRTIDLVAPVESTVLISGDTGTGKELIARALHDRSSRRERALVKVNCGAITAGLVESELFGHVKGAFTGALTRRVGRFELADGGTVFLDEVGELPPDVQVKLLRVLQEQEFEPVGSSKTVRVDVRVIAATNRDLAEQVRAGQFRADLYYRLNVIPITVPPLRDRREDIPQLAMFFLHRIAHSTANPVRGIAPETLQLLCEYEWPGNVRELQNVIERAVVMTGDPILRISPHVLLSPSGRTAQPAPQAAAPMVDPFGVVSMEEMERRHIVLALDRTRWVIEGPQGAAQLLQQNPSTLRSRMKKLGISRVH